MITERDVRRAKAEGKASIDAGDAVVTPSAREVAATLQVSLSSATAAQRPASPSRDRARQPQRSPGTTAGRRGGRPAAQPDAAPARPDARGGPSGTPPGPGAQPRNRASAPPSPLTIAIGADHGGVALKATLIARLRELGHEVADVGTHGPEAVDYPDFAEAVGRMVGEGRATFGIMIDGAGIGSCMAANKVARVRAAMCYDVTTAANAREHNFANVLTLGGGLIGPRLAVAIVETFLATPTGAERHAARVAKIDALDRRG